MIGRFRLFAAVSTRPPGRCPGCRRLALVPTAPRLDGPAPPDDWTHYCKRCGARCRRRFGHSWQELTTSGDLTWLDEPEVAASHHSLTLPKRFRIRELMIVVV